MTGFAVRQVRLADEGRIPQEAQEAAPLTRQVEGGFRGAGRRQGELGRTPRDTEGVPGDTRVRRSITAANPCVLTLRDERRRDRPSHVLRHLEPLAVLAAEHLVR